MDRKPLYVGSRAHSAIAKTRIGRFVMAIPRYAEPENRVVTCSPSDFASLNEAIPDDVRYVDGPLLEAGWDHVFVGRTPVVPMPGTVEPQVRPLSDFLSVPA